MLPLNGLTGYVPQYANNINLIFWLESFENKHPIFEKINSK
jgi:hypothetical protein